MKRAIIVLLLVAAVGAGAGAYYLRRGGPEITVNTAPVTRGEIVDAVGATGTLQAVNTVQVGSQVSGNIQYLGADFNSIVRQGQVIARLDPSMFDAQLQQTRANLLQAQANLARAQSDLERSKVQLLDVQQKFARAKELTARNLMPQSEFDSAKIAVDAAQASLVSQQATVAQTQAAVSQSQASVNQSQVNLGHTVITAPIDGIVTQRSVDVGQTVAASMSAPTLFVIAADLTKMQVNANIDESDVGRIRPGQHVTFRVDAYPTDAFEGTVSQVRLQPVVVSNVTTYGTVIDVPNPQLKLKPGMTANVRVEIAKRADALRLPTGALRFRPTPDIFAALNQPAPPEAQPAGGGRGGRGAMGMGGGRNGAGGDLATTPAPAAAVPAAAAPAATATAPQGLPAGGNVQPGAPPSSGSGRGGRGDASVAASGAELSGGGRGGGRGGFDPARMMERFTSMSSDEQTQFVGRMKERGQDASAFEKVMTATAPVPKPASGAPQAAQTIDALFAPLPFVETRGRAWLFMGGQLKPVNLRLGISDGLNTEVLGDELQPNMEVVTSVTGLTSAQATPGATGAGNPMMPQRGGPPGRGR
jgi:HlyD family secretion protein